MLTLFAACMLTSTVPVLRCQSLIDAGNAAWVGRGDRQQAATFFAKAAWFDPLSPDPLLRQAELAFDRWSNSADATDADFEECVRYTEFATENDPVSPVGYRMLGQFQMQKYQRAGNVAAAAAAARAFASAVTRYPHYAPLRAELATALFCARDFTSAHREAEEALALDSINHREGHEDKYFDHATATALQEIIKRHIH
jgi:tetratricopeptide (TPR) repeat protein